MKLYLKQHVFTWGDRFSVYDAAGNDAYYVEGEIFTFGKRLHLLARDGNEILLIHQRLFTWLPCYTISVNGTDVAEVRRDFTFFHQQYTVEALGWHVEGDFFAHEYTIFSSGSVVATVSKEWFTWGDCYEIDIVNDADAVKALSVVLVIDACLASQNN